MKLELKRIASFLSSYFFQSMKENVTQKRAREKKEEREKNKEKEREVIINRERNRFQFTTIFSLFYLNLLSLSLSLRYFLSPSLNEILSHSSSLSLSFHNFFSNEIPPQTPLDGIVFTFRRTHFLPDSFSHSFFFFFLLLSISSQLFLLFPSKYTKEKECGKEERERKERKC